MRGGRGAVIAASAVIAVALFACRRSNEPPPPPIRERVSWPLRLDAEPYFASIQTCVRAARTELYFSYQVQKEDGVFEVGHHLSIEADGDYLLDHRTWRLEESSPSTTVRSRLFCAGETSQVLLIRDVPVDAIEAAKVAIVDRGAGPVLELSCARAFDGRAAYGTRGPSGLVLRRGCSDRCRHAGDASLIPVTFTGTTAVLSEAAICIGGSGTDALLDLPSLSPTAPLLARPIAVDEGGMPRRTHDLLAVEGADVRVLGRLRDSTKTFAFVPGQQRVVVDTAPPLPLTGGPGDRRGDFWLGSLDDAVSWRALDRLNGLALNVEGLYALSSERSVLIGVATSSAALAGNARVGVVLSSAELEPIALIAPPPSVVKAYVANGDKTTAFALSTCDASPCLERLELEAHALP